jgi:peroxiredoxin
LPQYRRQNVQVLGISVDDSVETATWAKEIGITFPLLSDKGGKVAKRFGLFDTKTNRAAKALAVVLDGQLVYSQKVSDTEVPIGISPWMEKLAATGR